MAFFTRHLSFENRFFVRLKNQSYPFFQVIRILKNFNKIIKNFFTCVYSALDVSLRSESSIKGEIKLKIISKIKIDFLKRPNGKNVRT